MLSIRSSLFAKVITVALILIISSSILYILLAHITVSVGLLLLILMICSTIFGYIFVQHIVVPLRAMAHEVHEMRAGRAYQIIKLENRVDELGVIARFFNEVVSTIDTVRDNIHDRDRLKKELNFAGSVQKQLLPKKAPLIPGLDVIVRTRSATEVGGDNFDFITREKDTLMYIGDATGHGFPAGLVMSMVNVLIQAAASMCDSATDILTQVNKALTPKTTATMFMTLVMLRWEHETQKLFFTGCGHEHILIYRAADQSCEVIKTGGIALGMITDCSKIIKEKEIMLQPNDTVILFTDGITEAHNTNGEMYGIERLQDAVQENGGKQSAEHIFSAISKAFSEYVGDGFVQDDDITLLVAKYNFKDVRDEHAVHLEIDTTGITGIERPNWEWEK